MVASTIENFCLTYDIKDFKKLKKFIRKFFIKVAIFILDNEDLVRNNTISPNKHLALAQIIYNYSSKIQYTKVKYLYSLRNMDIYTSSKYGKKIVLFGDIHTKGYGCDKKSQPTSDFIINQIETSTCFLDIFLEIPYLFGRCDTKLELEGTYMADLHRDLSKCFEYTKDCQYNNIRAHYIDLRSPKLSQDFFLLQRAIINSFNNMPCPKYITDKLLKSENLQNIFSSKDNIINFMYKLVKTNKIQKQIDNIKDEKVRKLLLRIEKERIENPDIDFNEISWDKIKEWLEESFFPFTLYHTLIKYVSIIVDVYTLARVFREFREVQGLYSKPCDNVMIYAGAYHTRTYQNFLELLEFSHVFSVKAKTAPAYCVDITDLKHPIFRESK
tara:strand:- start:2490 stop:3644 length:1155 start_codon:yes stop_codon:yes gene_type:complete